MLLSFDNVPAFIFLTSLPSYKNRALKMKKVHSPKVL